MFLIQYLNHIKKIDECSEETVKKLFKIPVDTPIFLQYMDEDLNSYIDCDWSEIKSLKCKKLKVCEEIVSIDVSSSSNNTEPNHEVLLRSDSADTVIINVADEQLEVADTNQLEGVPALQISNVLSLNEFMIEEHSHPVNVEDEANSDLNDSLNVVANDNSPGISSQESISEQENDPNISYGVLPSSYILPFINPNSNLGKALEKKVPLSKGLKSLFLAKIHESFTGKKIYNLGSYNRDVVNAILSKYPHLGMGLAYASAMQLWTKTLYAKFYNAKKRECAEDEEVVNAKRKKELLRPAVIATQMENMWGIPNYCPKSSEDDHDPIIIDSHKSWMTTEFKKEEKNLSALKKRMDITFFNRRMMLFHLKDNGVFASSSEILQHYPCLGIENQAVEELNRLFGKCHFQECNVWIQSFSLAVAQQVCLSKSKYKNWMTKLMNSSAQDHEKTEMLKLVGNIAVLLSEDPSLVVGREMSPSGCPFLKLQENSEIILCVDNLPFLTTISPKLSAYLWVGAFYCFNIVVPNGIKKTFNFLQYIFFNIPKSPSFKTQSMVRLLQLFKSCEQ